MKKPFLIIGFLVFCLNLLPQGGMVKHYGVEEGLASNRVYSAFQDSKGFLWFATTNGVSRFDGKKFKNFTSTNGLPDNDIFDIAEDATGRIWLSCYNGEPCYIYHNKIYTGANDTQLRKIPANGYFRFCYNGRKLLLCKSETAFHYEVDKKGELHSTRLNGVYYIEFEKNILQSLQAYRIREANYYLLDSAYNVVDSLSCEMITKNAGPEEIKDLFPCGNNRFVVLLKNGTSLLYTIQNNRIQFAGKGKDAYTYTATYRSGDKIWINVYNKGLIPMNDKFERDPERDILFPHQTIQNFIVDREGNYWCCTSGNGLYMIPNNQFSYIFSETTGSPGDILKLTTYKSEVYMAGTKNIFRHNGKKDQEPAASIATLDERIVDMYADSTSIVVATGQALLFIDKKNYKPVKVPFDNIKCMRRGYNGTVLFGSHSGCYELDPSGKTTRIYNQRTVAVCPRKNGNFLIGTLYGLFEVQKKEDGTWATNAVKTPAILEKTRVSCIEEIDDIVVVGTVQHGLFLIRGNDYESVDLGEDFKHLNCKDVYIDPYKNIWLSSFSGVFQICPDRSIHSYTVKHLRHFNGLLSDDVNDVCMVNDSVYVAGPKGVSRFTWRRDSVNSAPPSLYIDEIVINGRPYGQGDIIQLPSDSSTIDLFFSAIDFKSMGHVLFKYRLLDLQKNWQYTKDNFARFEGLSPGTYTFEIKAMNSRNQWTSGAVTQIISIAPAWWQTTWFRLLCVFVGTALVYLITKRRLSQKHLQQMRENSLKRHAAELELRALKAQINPHFIFNTLNTIQYFIDNNENEKAEEYLNRMASLLRKTLDFSDKTTIPLNTEVAYLENYLELEKLRFDEHFKYSIVNTVETNRNSVEIPPMVLQPHVENALRHAFKDRQMIEKKLDIRFALSNNQLVCEVHDNGIGRSAAGKKQGEFKGQSRGTELSHSKLLVYESITGKTIRTEIHDQYGEDKKAAGTLVKIYITQ